MEITINDNGVLVNISIPQDKEVAFRGFIFQAILSQHQSSLALSMARNILNTSARSSRAK